MSDTPPIAGSLPVRIMGAHHEPVQPYLIQSKMEQLMIAYAESAEHIVTKLARFHIEPLTS